MILTPLINVLKRFLFNAHFFLIYFNREMAATEAAAREVSAQYEAQLAEMAGAVGAKETEIEALKRDLSMLEGDRARTEGEKRKMREGYEEKVAK
jgi:Skp family chaperone for outer membrane proteins